MPTRGKRKGEERARQEFPERAAPPSPAPQEDDAIEILEVVGVDETTGEVRETPRPGRHDAAAGEPAGEPAADLREAVQEKEKYHDLFLRAQAEFENFRKRVDKDAQLLRAAATADLVLRLLPVIDNLERALLTAQGKDDPLRRGVDLIHQQLRDALAKEGLAPIDAVGSTFDPHRHEAVEVRDVPGFEQGMVLEELQKGYTLNGRLLRPALVKVASGRASGGEDHG